MAITWQNINTPNFGGANDLAVAGGDSLVSGIRTLQDAAREEGQRRINQFDAGTSRNTADILNQVSNADVAGLDAFNTNSLRDTFGSQIDLNQITDAITGRRNLLKQDARAEELHDLNVEGKGLGMDLTKANISANDRLLAKEESQLDADNYFMSKLAEFNDPDEATQAVARYATENKLPIQEAARLERDVASVWKSNFDLTQPQQEKLVATANQGMEYNKLISQNAMQTLDREALKQGLTPQLLSYATDTSGDVADVFTEFNAAAEDGMVFTGSSVDLFKDKFNTKLHRNPTAAEARYILSLSQADRWYGSGGIDHSKMTKSIDRYLDLLGDSKAVEWYREGKNKIATAANTYATDINSKIKDLTSTAKANRKKAYSRDYNYTPITEQNLDMKTLAPKDLIDFNWMKPPTLDTKDKKGASGIDTNNNAFWQTPR